MKIRIINKQPSLERPEITFEIWGRGVKIINSKKYTLVEYAIKAAKLLARNLNIVVTSATYEEPDYTQPLKWMSMNMTN